MADNDKNDIAGLNRAIGRLEAKQDALNYRVEEVSKEMAIGKARNIQSQEESRKEIGIFREEINARLADISSKLDGKLDASRARLATIADVLWDYRKPIMWAFLTVVALMVWANWLQPGARLPSFMEAVRVFDTTPTVTPTPTPEIKSRRR